ncbi:MAG: hypothetical protein ABSF28_21215 [Terracidiphilus sp.]
MKATGGALGQARDPLAYAGAALILLALAANEQPALIGAASQNHSGIDAGTVWHP